MDVGHGAYIVWVHGWGCGGGKENLSIKWGFLTEDELSLIKGTMLAGFFPFTFRDDGIDLTIESYRGTLSKEVLGDLGDGTYWYKSVSVDVIQR